MDADARDPSSRTRGRPRRHHEEDGRDAQGDAGKVTAKLNDEQQKTWKELIGAPFEFKYDPRPAQ